MPIYTLTIVERYPKQYPRNSARIAKLPEQAHVEATTIMQAQGKAAQLWPNMKVLSIKLPNGTELKCQ